MNPALYTVGDVLMALDAEVLTKAEAKAAIADLIPAVKKIADARTLLAAEEN
jgi:hypothetical protein